VPPASIAHSTLSSRAAWRGAPHREGCFAEAAFSTARSARSPTSDAPGRRLGKPRRVRANCTVPVSRSTLRSARSAFHQQVLPAPACAGQGARHRFPEQVPGIGFRRYAFLARARKAEPTRTFRVCRPDAGQAKRRLSTSAITAVLQHNCGRIRHPAHLGKELPPWLGDAGSPPPSGARPAELSRVRGRRGLLPSPASPRAMTRRGASPRSGRLGHLMSRNRACAGRRVPAQEMEQVPAKPPPDSVQDAARTRA